MNEIVRYAAAAQQLSTLREQLNTQLINEDKTDLLQKMGYNAFQQDKARQRLEAVLASPRLDLDPISHLVDFHLNAEAFVLKLAEVMNIEAEESVATFSAARDALQKYFPIMLFPKTEFDRKQVGVNWITALYFSAQKHFDYADLALGLEVVLAQAIDWSKQHFHEKEGWLGPFGRIVGYELCVNRTHKIAEWASSDFVVKWIDQNDPNACSSSVQLPVLHLGKQSVQVAITDV